MRSIDIRHATLLCEGEKLDLRQLSWRNGTSERRGRNFQEYAESSYFSTHFKMCAMSTCGRSVSFEVWSLWVCACPVISKRQKNMWVTSVRKTCKLFDLHPSWCTYFHFHPSVLHWKQLVLQSYNFFNTRNGGSIHAVTSRSFIWLARLVK